MRHDPGRMAAAYLGGGLRARQRERFEAHILECDGCWQEVRLARRGQALAESTRELAPQPLRERVRATVAASATSARRRRPLQVALALALLLALLAGGLLVAQRPAQPEAIAAALASYHDDMPGWRASDEPPPALRLGDLQWRGSERGEVGGLPVIAHAYADEAGHRVVLLRSQQSFPEALDARHEPRGDVWIAEVDGVVLFCADRPAPSLIVGQDRAEVLMAAQRLGLG